MTTRTIRPIRDIPEASSVGVQIRNAWNRLNNRKALVAARIAKRDEANKADRIRLASLTARDSELVDRYGSRLFDFVSGAWDSLPKSAIDTVDLETVKVRRYSATQGKFTFTVNEATTVAELRELVASGQITQADFDEVVKCEIRRDPLKKRADILARLKTAFVERGSFYGMEFPAVEYRLNRPVALWQKLRDKYMGTQPVDTPLAS